MAGLYGEYESPAISRNPDGSRQSITAPEQKPFYDTGLSSDLKDILAQVSRYARGGTGQTAAQGKSLVDMAQVLAGVHNKQSDLDTSRTNAEASNVMHENVANITASPKIQAVELEKQTLPGYIGSLLQSQFGNNAGGQSLLEKYDLTDFGKQLFSKYSK